MFGRQRNCINLIVLPVIHFRGWHSSCFKLKRAKVIKRWIQLPIDSFPCVQVRQQNNVKQLENSMALCFFCRLFRLNLMNCRLRSAPLCPPIADPSTNFQGLNLCHWSFSPTFLPTESKLDKQFHLIITFNHYWTKISMTLCNKYPNRIQKVVQISLLPHGVQMGG